MGGRAHLTNLGAEVMLSKIFDEITYKEIPWRRKASRVFIKEAIEVAEKGKYDLEIYESESKVTAEFSFDLCRALNDLKGIMTVADCIDALPDENGREVKLVLYYLIKSMHHGDR